MPRHPRDTLLLTANHVAKRYQGYAPREKVASVCYEDIRATPLVPCHPRHPRNALLLIANHAAKRYQGYAPREKIASVCYEDIRATPLVPSDPRHPRNTLLIACCDLFFNFQTFDLIDLRS